MIRWAKWFRGKGNLVSVVSLTRTHDRSVYDIIQDVPAILGPFAYLRRGLFVRKVVKSLAPDIVHGHYLTSAGFFSSLTTCPHKVVSAWGSDIYSDAKVWSKRQCIKWAINHSDVTLGDSDHIVNAVKQLVPKVDARKVIFGIDTELFKPNPIKHDKFRFLSIRATGGVYNSLTLVEAFEQAGLDAELWMQEPMADGCAVKDYVKSRPKLDRKVVWYSRRPYEEMPKLYNSCDVALSVPEWDSSSAALNEALSCGLLVVASDIPQNREWIVDKKNGFLASSFTLPDVMSKASQLHMDAVVSMGRNARQTIVEKADFNKEMDKAEAIYREVAD